MNSEWDRPNGHELPSPAGDVRRETIRNELQTEFVRFHARRRRSRSILAWLPAAVLLIATSVWWSWNARSWKLSVHPVATQNHSPEISKPSSAEIALTASAKPRIEIELIGDDQLLDLLAEAGQPSALAWIKGKPVVIPLKGTPVL